MNTASLRNDGKVSLDIFQTNSLDNGHTIHQTQDSE